MPKKQTDQSNDKGLSTGMYKLTCPECGNALFGQIGRSFIKWF